MPIVASPTDEGKWDFHCPEEKPPCGFISFSHETKASAKRREAEHKAEHETGVPMNERPS